MTHSELLSRITAPYFSSHRHQGEGIVENSREQAQCHSEHKPNVILSVAKNLQCRLVPDGTLRFFPLRLRTGFLQRLGVIIADAG